MTELWIIFAPLTAAALALVAIAILRKLHFFSRIARDLPEMDSPNEFREVRVAEFEILIGADADGLLRFGWRDRLSLLERQHAVGRRLQRTRKFVKFIISNAALFEQVARFHIGAAEEIGQEDEMAYKLMDRASMVHFMGVICLMRLMLVDVRRVMWPNYVPALADHFLVGSRDLVLWYKNLVREVLELAKRYDEDIYARFILQLTGLFTIEDAAEFGRI